MIAFFLFTATSAFALDLPADVARALGEATVKDSRQCDAEGNQNDAKESLCSGTVASVCSGPVSPRLGERESALSAAEKQRVGQQTQELMQGMEGGQGISAETMRRLVQFAREGQRKVERISAAHGVPAGATRRQFDRIKQLLLEKISSVPQLSGAAGRVRAIRLFDADALAQASPEDAINFFMNCGVDGMTPNASYLPEKNQVTVCPGFLLQNLRAEGIDVMNLILAHELSHAVDPFVKEQGRFIYRPAYERFLACVRQDYGKEFVSLDGLRKQLLGPRQAAIDACQRKLSLRRPAQSALQTLEAAMSAWEQDMGKLEETVQRRRQAGDALDAISTHANEITSDLLGVEISASLLKQAKLWDRPGIVRAQLAMFCQADEMEKKIVNLCGPGAAFPKRGEDGSHPAFSYRIEAMLRDRGTRAALGCQPVKAGAKPWCTLSGRTP